MLIDCDTCVVRGDGCGDCVISAMLPTPPVGIDWDDVERHALAILADAGLASRVLLDPDRDSGAGVRLTSVPTVRLPFPTVASDASPRAMRDRQVG